MDLLITRLELYGFKRLLTKQVKSVVYDVVEDLQVIIGGNGYGKSSVFYELSPLPAASKDFMKGGYKKISITANGKQYQLNSIFNSGNHHEFIVDGVELNTGHTILVQKQLVEGHFKYNTTVHEVLVGKLKFTDMSMAARKEWLAMLSPATVDYALTLHKHFSTELRNIVGAEQNVKKKIIEVSKEVMDEDALEEIVQAIDEYRPKILKLLEARPRVDAFTPQETEQLNSVVRLQDWHTAFLNTYVEIIEGVKGSTLEVAMNSHTVALIDERSCLAETKATRTAWLEEYLSIEETIADFDFSDGRTTAEIELELVSDRTLVAKGIKSPDWVNTTKDPMAAINALVDSAYDALLALATDIEPNPQLSIYNSSTHTQENNAYEELLKKELGIRNQLAIAQSKYQEAIKQEHVTCPKCENTFNPCTDALSAEKIDVYITKLSGELAEVSDGLATKLESLKRFMKWQSDIRQYENLVKSYPVLECLWNELEETELITTSPKNVPGVATSYLKYCKMLKEFRDVEARIEANELALVQRSKALSRNTEKLTTRMADLKVRIDEAADVISVSEKIIACTEATLDSLVKVEAHLERASNAGTRINELMKQDVELGVAKIIDDEVANLTRTVNEMAKDVSRSTAQHAIKEHLETNRRELIASREAHRLLVDALSPTHGIVADVLLGFITAVTEQMNEIAHKFWTTPFKVLPCSVTNSGLDYKFPIESVSKDVITDDIRNGSEGEKELVNFLFMMIVRLYLGYQNYPMFLDEVGARFHESNRSGLYNYIKALLESKYVSQVFVISHFESTYNTLSHAQVNVLDGSGILVTPDSNQHFNLA